MKKRIQVVVLQVISILGLLICAYLYLSHLSSNYFCPVGDCSKVNGSRYSEIGNVPMSILGLIFYTFLFSSTFLLDKKTFSIIPKMTLVVGLLFSVYLTYLELFIINAICFWCVVSFGLIIIGSVIVFNPRKIQVSQG
ncbi:vitamin K epoxide reductase family protein [Pseudalkalibacillus decolorationis]|uniref:vitamin K epoxide reductase family protein n=1 Tax=Pseudalkalibacillus decolorationis TaxID=163879 RepID=UPI00214933A7|nr:vitamin K epoxide reductase family protein [Pseudalkalibacillus decolorationis]